MTLGLQDHEIGPGAVMHIPVGTRHAVRNTGTDTLVTVSVFTPPFDGKDRIFEDPR